MLQVQLVVERERKSECYRLATFLSYEGHHDNGRPSHNRPWHEVSFDIEAILVRKYTLFPAYNVLL
jgi:hypothetical protein